MSPAVLGGLAGLLAGAGLWLVVHRIPAFRRPRLEHRLAPYVRDAGATLRPVGVPPRTVTPFPTLERILGPQIVRAAQGLERFLGGTAGVRRRLEQARVDLSVEEFRVEQLVWGGLAFAAAVALCLVELVRAGISALPLVFVCVAAFIGGVLLRDRYLSVQVRRREERMVAEFPTVADLLALSVGAGEGPVGALERVARISGGELAKEIQVALGQARTGSSLVRALEAMADRTSLPVLARFVDGVAVAVERGTPLADVLRAQAADVREVTKRQLIETGGRKEVGMMVPVVFLVLPVTLLFAMYPAAVQLTF